MVVICVEVLNQWQTAGHPLIVNWAIRKYQFGGKDGESKEEKQKYKTERNQRVDTGRKDGESKEEKRKKGTWTKQKIINQ